MEPPTAAKTATWVQCENAPPGLKAEIVPFTVSLKGDFSDISNSLSYRYYNDVKVWAIYPRYGEKDGGTRVDVWGENFLNFEQFTRCGFGSKTVQAVFVNSNYMYCFSPASDVVEKGIPFIVTLNAQQNSNERINFWYYNKPSIQNIYPNRGPDDGGNEIVITGNNFDPFKYYEINNHNDTFCKFIGLSLMPATVLESTKIAWNVPPSYVNRETVVEITLNNQQFTDDNVVYTYYKPPYIFDTDPRQGPTKGDTEVTLIGTNFKENTTIICKFGNQAVEGKYLTKHKISWLSPPHPKAEFVPISVSFEQDLWSSGQIKYLYYDQPTISKIEPTWGPESGYTQITVYGANFINLGLGKVHWVFNRTVNMNATVMESDIIKCDSPPAQGWYRSDTKEPRFYNVEITLDGTLFGGPPQRFNYYKEPEINSIFPIMGPIEGGTELTISGVGFGQTSVWNPTIRFGNIYAIPSKISEYEIQVKTPEVDVPDAVVVAVGLNGQQFTKDKTLHFKDEENTFYYYDNPIIYGFTPDKGMSNGGTLVKIKGRGFLPKKYENGTFIPSPVYVRMLESGTRKQLGPTVEAEATENEEVQWRAPPAPAGTKGIISLSLNNHQFYELYHQNQEYSFEYVSSPFVTSIDPEFGEVRQAETVSIDVHGRNFDCDSDGWGNVRWKFGKDPEEIIVKGQRIASDLIKCPLPNYPQPNVLDVEVTLNGKDYSNNGKQFGFYDPFVLQVSPKLISKTGSTRVEIKGFGFVNSQNVGGLKVLYDNDLDQYFWTNNLSKWAVDATFVDKNKITAPTLPLDMIKYQTNEKIKESDPINVEVAIFNDRFTKNHIKVYYYIDPILKFVKPISAPANTQSPVMIEADFNMNLINKQVFFENAKFQWRFTSIDKTEIIYTDGEAISYPYKSDADPTHVKCNTPIWPLNGKEKEGVRLDVTVNGYDYYGGFDFLFTDRLEIYRIQPPSGPNEGRTEVKFIGTGFRAQQEIRVKWGVVDLELLEKDKLAAYLGVNFEKDNDYSSSSDSVIQIKQRDIEQKKSYDTLYLISPKLSNWDKTNGGPVYVEIGAKDSTPGNDQKYDMYSYTTSFTEFYYYKQPIIRNIYPHGGPIEGGTEIVVEGADFQFFPEYGVIPYWQIGDRIVKGKFESTVRIICPSPPGVDIDRKIPILVSLNGQNFIETGKYFHYYKNSEIKGISPTSGPNTGGTSIKLTGEHFSDLSSSDEFLCRFKPLNGDIPPKYVHANYLDKNTILWSSPGGFGNVDAVTVDVSFNGIDYTNNKNEFRYYNIITAAPRSGPADGVGQSIKIYGQGFKDDGNIKWRLDNVESKPNNVNWNEISWPVVPAKQGKDYFGNVPFEVSINGEDWQMFTGGFQYYEQPIVNEIYPRHGPNVGHGKIKFYGDKFRSDFQLAQVFCKIGDSYGKAKVIDQKNLEWEISDLTLSGNDNGFPAQVSLNNASWTVPNSNAYYSPYGIHHITPNSGPSVGGTEITIVGSGFEDTGEAKWRFGVPGDYIIVSGKVLSNDKMVWKSPIEYKLPTHGSFPFSVPFSIAFNKEEYDPWTQSAHRFRFYEQPIISRWTPSKSDIGLLKEVYIYSNDYTEFIQPIPIEGTQYSDYGILCKFGKLGSTPGALINSTLIKCVTPTITERPEDVDKEVVVLSIALNSQNFNENESTWDYTFVGTGTGTSFWPWIIALILVFILLIAIILWVAAIIQRNAMSEPRRTFGPSNETEAPHVLGKRPRGVPGGPMEYEGEFRGDRSGVRGTDNSIGRSDFRGNDPYDTRGKIYSS